MQFVTPLKTAKKDCCNKAPELLKQQRHSFLRPSFLWACALLFSVSTVFAGTRDGDPPKMPTYLPDCGGGPCDAERWEDGAAWNAACPNAGGLIDDGPSANGGVVRCGNSAETQSNIGPNSCYDPNVFTAFIGGTCYDPNTGLPTTVTLPLVDQQVLWFNFDVRAYAGGYDFQVIGGNEDIAWILYYSDTPQNCVGGITPGISGDCNSLSYYACGTSFGGWAAQSFTTPIFDLTTNVYLMVWDQGFSKGDVGSDNFSVTFKARYGCGENCAFALNGAPTITCLQDGSYTVVQNVVGTSTSVNVFAAGSTSIVTNPSPLTFTSVEPGPPPNVNSGTVTVTYPPNVNYSIIFDPTGTGAACASDTLSGIAPDCCEFPVCDITGDTIVCPGTTNVYCSADTAAAYLWTVSPGGTIVGSDSSQCVTVTASALCNTTYTVSLTTGITGCQATCSSTVTVTDAIGPVVTCATQTTPVACPDVPVFTPPSVSDNCDLTPTLTFADVTAAGACPNTYSTTRTWTATDDCGNTGTCSATIVVNDVLAPQITCPPNLTIQCTASTAPGGTNGTATATDSCDGTPTITSSDVTTAGACPQEYTITRTWVASDDCGNSVSCTQTIVVDDSVAPVITLCPPNVTISCTDSTAPGGANGMATATDNCDGTVTVTFSDMGVPGACPQEFTIIRVWIATDDCGNSSTCTQSIVVDDNVAPTIITCPANITIQCSASTAPGATNGPATATDNCDSSPTVTFTDVTAAGGCPQEYTITRTWQATDDCGNSSTCSQTILVDDSMAPAITCPPNVTIQCTASTAPGGANGVATATDNCDGTPTITSSDVTTAGACPQEYTITRTWTATDDCGNSTACVQTLVVDDSVAPNITCPPNLTIQCTASTAPGGANGVATATDNCDATPTITSTDVTVGGACPQEYTILRTWQATDDCGNSNTCLQTIFVDDSTPPVITFCPPNVTIQCTASTAPGGSNGVATATDNCDATPTITFSDVTTGGSACQEFTITRTWRAIDDCGNSSSCVQTLSIDDNLPPTITLCPANITIQCTASTAPGATNGPATATDSCDPTPTVTFSDVTTGGACPQEYSIVRTWIATDDCGNSSTCSQTIVVDDSMAPVITCPPNITIQCTASTAPGGANGTATATDNCDLTPTITSTDVTIGGACPQEYTIQRTWIATDDCGNSSTCLQTIFVDDSTPPVITFCPPNITIECTASTAPGGSNGTATATDNCDLTPTITSTDVTIGGACPQEYTIQRTWRATDDCGNSSTCLQTIFVDDSTPPVITFCPPNITIQCTASTAPGGTNGTATATDNCDLTPTITSTDVTIGGACPQEYTIQRTWRATDDCGNSSSCLQTIFVDDSMAPVITCPPSITIQCTASTAPGGTNGVATATDNCDPTPTITSSDVTTGGACPQEYTITRTWTATDDCGNSTACIQTIFVDDSMAPVITCPPNLTIECTASTAPGGANGTATATDNCDLTPTITSTDVTIGGACPQEYTIQRTWRATDDCGNSSTCLQTIFVDDSTPPVITFCPPNITIECTASTAPGGSNGTATATDNCDLTPTITSTDVTIGGACPQEYTIQRTWRATDDCGNSSTCLQTIFVDDSTPPVITFCPPNITIQCTASTAPGGANGTATATDNCDPTPTITSTDVTIQSTVCPQEYTINRTWRATDDCGNSSTCLQVIVVDDSTPPVITCPPNLTIQCTASTAPGGANGTATATDNCDLTPTITSTDVTIGGACPQEYTIQRTWRATDDCGNSSTCLQTIFVDDSTPPVITCPPNLTIECTASTAPGGANGTATATDNCDLTPTITSTDVTIGGACPQEYTIQRTWRATDDCGNSSTCLQTIFVDDSTPPVITCPPNLTIDCTASTAPGGANGTATATDNCDLTPTITSTDVTIAGGCPQEYTIQRTWRATDDCGNSSTCLQTIFVDDSTPPVVTCPPNVTVECATDVPPLNTGLVMASDNCSSLIAVVHVVDLIQSLGCFNRYNITRVYRATDECGNSATCTQSILVFDDTPPQITCPPNVTFQCASDLPPSDISQVTATDNCSGGAPVITFVGDVTTAGSCINRFTVTRTYRATDVCGNSATCTQLITIFDNTPPVITCPPNLTIECTASTAPGGANGTATATDNCAGTITITSTDVTIGGACPQEYTINRTWRATDVCGNSSTCLQTIFVDDSTPPVITCPPNLTIECTASTAPGGANGVATATDNCDPTPTITSTDVTIAGACPQEYTINRTWRATDDCGNSSTCLQTIFVDDSTPPVITCPQDITLECTASTAPGGTNGTATATDNCDPTPTITSTDVTIQNETCPQEYTILRTWRATDDCGNSSSCLQVIVVDDSTPPVITCPPNLTIECTASTAPGGTNGTATATDNCDPTPTITSTDVTIQSTVCPQEYTINRTWSATDDCGNSSTCLQVIVVDDSTPPVITCPPNLTIECTASTAPGGANGTATATDNCDPTPTITSTDVTIGGACPQEYTINRTWRATDDCGNSSTCLQTIFVDDSTPPVITCPPNLTIECTASTAPGGTNGVATATDNCDPTPSITSTDVTIAGACPQEYTINRTWRATDDCGNSSTCLQTIFVDDSTPPVITCPQDITLECTASTAPGGTNGTATATDNCDPTPTITSTDVTIQNETCPQEYTILRTWRATDDCGNSSSCLQVIVVDDSTPPVITCPPNLTIECTASTAPGGTNGTATATDNCDPTPTITSTDVTIQSTVCPQEYTINRTWRATDECGNSSTCLQVILVDDSTPPVITCPPNLTLECTASTAPGETNGTATATDNCDATPTITSSDVTVQSPTCPQEYTINRTWRATDDCGNSSTCLQVIVVDDSTAPVITCPPNLTLECSANTAPGGANGTATATDNCDATPTVTSTDVTIQSPTCPQEYTINRTWRATDDCGNSSTCLQVILVDDSTPPGITCPAAITVQCHAQVPAPNIGSVITTDNCDATPTVTFVDDVTTNQTCVNRYTLTRTYRSTDDCGNSSTCQQVITVFDSTPPTITCPANITVTCAFQVPAPNPASVTTSDNCTGPAPVVTHVMDVTTNQTCVNRYTLTRTYRSTDACGNSATCAQIITVFDNVPPTLTCPANITVQCANQVPAPNPASVTTSDNCTGPAPVVTFVSDVTTNQTCINRYTLTRTYRSTDACGNSATCTQVITVFDNTPPTITPLNPILMGVPNNGTIEVQCFGQDPEWELPTFGPGDVQATDNCTGTVTVLFDDTLVDEGDCPVDGYINRYRLRWTATDACGNSSSLTIFLNLIDTIPPVILGVPDDITVNCDEIPEQPTLTAVDECLCACVVEMAQQGPAPGCQDGQVIIRTWEAHDYCGNVTIEQQLITLVDDEGPELTIEVPELAGLPDSTILQYTCNEGGIPEFFDDLNAESVSSPFVCDGLPNITFDEETIISRNCKFFGYIEQRTYVWTGVDDCGNETTLTIIAQLIDDEPPVIVGLPEMACFGDPALENIEATDNCDKVGLVWWDVPIPSVCGDGRSFRRTYEAVDPCGNYERDTVILIEDNTPPTMHLIGGELEGNGNGEYLIVECNEDGGFYTPYNVDNAVVEDDCPGVQVEFEQTIMQDLGCVDQTVNWLQLTWTATDICGNSASLYVYVYIIDETPPVFDAFPAEVTVGCNDEWPTVSATDNCSEPTVETRDSIIASDCEWEYDVIRTLTATDPCGNVSTATQIIHVGDQSGPDIQGVDPELCNDLSIPEVTAWDPCAEEFVEVTMTEELLELPCPGKVVVRIWTATDLCGNTSTAEQHIVVGDTVPPVIQVPTWSIIRKYMDNIDNFVNLSEEEIIEQLNELDESSVFADDVCDIWIIPEFSVVVTYADNCEEEGWWEHRVYTWTATDICGNVTVLTFEIDIMDDVPPVFENFPADITVICDELPAPPVVAASDYASPVDIEYEQIITDGGAPGHFIVKRTWTATDPCGNVTQASQSILWIPDTFGDCDILLPGLVECNSHGVVIGSDLLGGIGPFTYEWEVIGQECFIQSGQGTETITIYVGFFDVQIFLTVTDSYGCQTVCQANLSCLDPLDQLIGNPDNSTPETGIVISGPVNNISSGQEDYLQQLTYWPNPANTVLNLSFDAKVEREVEIVFMNFLGETVLTDQMKAEKGLNTRRIDVSGIPEGAYLFQVMTDKEIHAKGIVIMR